MKIKQAVVKREINTDKDIEIFQTTKFEKRVKCRNIICVGERWDIDARDINAWNIDARDINAWNIDARDINALNINARDINALNINAWDINAWDINAWDIDAWDIDAWDIDAWNINAWNIDARDIICEKRLLKETMARTICRAFVQNRSAIERKDRNSEIKGAGNDN